MLLWSTLVVSFSAASSSRSHLALWVANAVAVLTWERSSVNFHWRPPLSVAIVTHLVTRPLMRPSVVHAHFAAYRAHGGTLSRPRRNVDRSTASRRGIRPTLLRPCSGRRRACTRIASCEAGRSCLIVVRRIRLLARHQESSGHTLRVTPARASTRRRIVA
jgi:hypothetical protein